MKKLLVVGGGSAGHVMPAVPVIRRLAEKGYRVTFVGTHSGLEEGLLGEIDVTYHGIAAGKLRRYFSWQNLLDVGRVVVGFLQSLVLLITNRPDVVFSKGGYVAFPVAAAAGCLRIPVVAHESDLTPGLANRLSLPFVRTLCISFAQTQDFLKSSNSLRVVHSGTPLRAEIVKGDALAGRRQLGWQHNDKPLLVITGGSLGATALNKLVQEALPQLLQKYCVLHVVGPGKCNDLAMQDYQQVEFIAQGWGDVLAAADVVVSRAGANALFELLALRKLNLLVPLPAQASRGDQIENAKVALSLGVSAVQDESELDLVSALEQLQSKRGQYQQALAQFVVPDAVSAICDEIEKLS